MMKKVIKVLGYLVKYDSKKIESRGGVRRRDPWAKRSGER